MSVSEQINDEDFVVCVVCSSVSNEINNFSVLFVDIPSQLMFIALILFNLSCAQIFSPLLEIQTNEAVSILLECFLKAYTKFFNFLSSD